MTNAKLAALLVTVLVTMGSFASAERNAKFPVVNLARDKDNGHDVHAHQRSSFDPETYGGGVYKVGYDACQHQLKSATDSVHITLSDDNQTLTAENVPSACMTIGGALTNNFAEGYFIPMGSDKLEITDVSEDTISRVQSVLGASSPASESAVDGDTARGGAGGVNSLTLNSTASSRLPSRNMKRRIAREARS